MITVMEYINCKKNMQNGLNLYRGISPLISAENLSALKRRVVRSQYASISFDDFKKLEILIYIISGTTLFQISDQNSDSYVDIWGGANIAEGYQMQQEVSRLYRMQMKHLTTKL